MAELLTALGVNLANNWGIFWACTAYTFAAVTLI